MPVIRTPPHHPGCPSAPVDSLGLTESERRILAALRAWTEQDGHSARHTARFLSVDSGMILDWLSGKRKPRHATLERIGAFLQGRALHD